MFGNGSGAKAPGIVGLSFDKPSISATDLPNQRVDGSESRIRPLADR
jgi:hypothetical protein